MIFRTYQQNKRVKNFNKQKFLQLNVSLKCYGSTAIWFSNQSDVAYFTTKWNAFKSGADQSKVVLPNYPNGDGKTIYIK